MLNDVIEIKKLNKSDTKNDSSQPGLICQTRDLSHDIGINS
jgi:hypothetical protein